MLCLYVEEELLKKAEQKIPTQAKEEHFNSENVDLSTCCLMFGWLGLLSQGGNIKTVYEPYLIH